MTSALAVQNSPLLVSAMATIFWLSPSLMRVETAKGEFWTASADVIVTLAACLEDLI